MSGCGGVCTPMSAIGAQSYSEASGNDEDFASILVWKKSEKAELYR